MMVYVGTSGYAYKEWKGEFYPEKIPPNEMLQFYAERLGAVEINNTFYHMPREKDLESWAQQVPDGFVFAVKAPQRITHVKRLKDVESETEYLFKTLKVLGGKLGPVLFQFPAFFRMNNALLSDFVGLIPEGSLCAFEFRSPSWRNDDTLGLLRSRGLGLCVADTDEEPAGEIVSTASWGYLRLRRSDYDNADLEAWAERVVSQEWEKAFVFFKHEEQAVGPKLAMRFAGMLKAING